MSNLSESIRKEIRRKKREEERMQNELITRKIMNIFLDDLEERLRRLESYNWTKVYVNSFMDFSRVSEKAENLGFMARQDGRKVFLYVPDIDENSGNMTWAQIMLKKFEQELERVRKKRKKVLIKECKRVAKKLIRGNFEIKDDVRLYVPSKEEITNEYEIGVIKEFFQGEKIEFIMSEYPGKWIFDFGQQD